MPSTKAEISIIIIALVICSAVAGGGVWFSLHDYSDIIDLIVQLLHRPDLKQLLTGQLFTAESYQTVYYLHWLIYPLDLSFFLMVVKYRAKLSVKLFFVLASCKSYLKSLLYFTQHLDKTKKGVLYSFAVFYLVISFYKISVRDIGYDEAWNYNYFINTPAWFPFVLFNTYPLYHFTAHFFDYLPFDHVVNIRLPAVLAGLFLCWLLFFVLGKYFSKISFYLTFLFAVTSYVFVAFSCIAKGVAFSLPLTLIMFYCAFKITDTENNNKRLYLLYVIAGILNIAALPTSFIFCMGALFFSFLHYNRSKNIRKALHFVIANIAVIGIASFFYMTTIINPTSAKVFFKTSAIADTNTFIPVTGQAITFFQKTGCFLFSNDFATAFLSLIAVLLLLLAISKTYRAMLLFCLICIILSFIIDIYSNGVLPDRAFAFLFVPYLVVAGIGMEWLFTRRVPGLIKYAFTAIAFGYLMATGFSNNRSFVNPPVYEQESKKVSMILLEHHVTTSYIQSHAFFIHYPMVLYYYTINNKEWKMNTWEENSTRYKAFDIADKYDCIITDANKKDELLPGYKNIYTGTDFLVFIKDPVLN